MSAAHAFTIPVRVTHLFTCLAALVFTVWTLTHVPHLLAPSSPFTRGPDFEMLAWIALIVLLFGWPAARASWRVAHRRPLVENVRILQRPIFWTLATFASLFAHFLVATVALAVWSTYPDFDGNAAGPLMLAALLYVFALVGCEVGLLWPDDHALPTRDTPRLPQ